jgi:hypothetical protein
MKLILTSFGLSHLGDSPTRRVLRSSPFYRMPPVSMLRLGNRFLLDYELLLLADTVIVDASTFDALRLPHPAYQEVAEIVTELNKEGFIQVTDFDSVISENRDLLKHMLQSDMRRSRTWIRILGESTDIWRDFAQRVWSSQMLTGYSMRDYVELHEYGHTMDMLRDYEHAYYSWGGRAGGDSQIVISQLMQSLRPEMRRMILSDYLSYVNANLVLGEFLDAGFHDWMDFEPFYLEKFLNIGRTKSKTAASAESVRQLFKVAVPEVAEWAPKSLIRVLKDKRVTELRELVDSSTRGDVVFDHEFANRILREVLARQKKINRIRTIASYMTLPIGFVPGAGTLLQKGIEEAIGLLAERAVRKPHGWFYLISDLQR